MRSAFMAEYGAGLLESHGTVMKEYVAVPDALLEQTDALAPYLAASFEYVSSLKPKATKKGRK